MATSFLGNYNGRLAGIISYRPRNFKRGRPDKSAAMDHWPDYARLQQIRSEAPSVPKYHWSKDLRQKTSQIRYADYAALCRFNALRVIKIANATGQAHRNAGKTTLVDKSFGAGEVSQGF
jgi:hypothetical protein